MGAAALSAVSWLAFVFAAFLVWTGWRMFRHRHDHGSEEKLVKRLQGFLPLASGPSEGRLVRREGGRRVLTTGGAALIAIAVVDVIFAVDSVPAILAITDDTFIVFAANAFALLGLRPLFFLVAELVERLYYLKTALAALLVFIGAKMAAGELFGKIGPEISLPVITAILATGVDRVADPRPPARAVVRLSAASAGDGAAGGDELVEPDELDPRAALGLAGAALVLVDRLPALPEDRVGRAGGEPFGALVGVCARGAEQAGLGVGDDLGHRVGGVLLVGADDAARAALDPADGVLAGDAGGPPRRRRARRRCGSGRGDSSNGTSSIGRPR